MDASAYRMVVWTEQDYVVAAATADRLVAEWLTGPKGYPATPLRDGRNEIAAQVTLDRDTGTGRNGAHTRWRLRERTPGQKGTWQSTLIIRTDMADPGRTWVQLDVEHRPDTPDIPQIRAFKPRLADALLDALEARNGLAEIRARASLIHPGDVPEVVEELCDRERRLPIVVASVPFGTDADRWLEDVVDRAFTQLVGRAVLYVLTREAQPAFNKTLEHHPVFGGGIRTYMPGVDPAWAADGQRHPVMSRATVEADPVRAATVLTALPRNLASHAPLPQALARLHAQAPLPPGAEHGDELARLKADHDSLLRLLDEAAEAEAARYKQVRELQHDLADANWLAEEFYAERRAAQQQVRVLQRRLQQVGAYEAAFAPVDDDEDDPLPGSFTELHARLGQFPTLVFTGDAKLLTGLDDRSKPNWVNITWEALLALEEFAAASVAGRARGDFRAWCQDLPSGSHPFPAGKVLMKESDTVWRNLSWRKERMLPVPAEVDPSGTVYMEAHLRIGGGSMISPRLHFYDDCAGTGRLYIGHIGPHLTNTRSS
ncbi:hypothetical protein AB0M29_16380 [Streptomyces sp. NPDC051976]|uniref:hypothetical protein n=1 Tax=Streptomyces sp. NPDC051976 TaxID=3154947 RepID=UPI003413BB4C